jgi:TRAP-type C4-dicarboxylate transport system substrate-binding protein
MATNPGIQKGEGTMKIASAIIALCLIAAASPIASRPASAEPFNLRAAHYFKEDHPWNKALVFFAKRVDEESKGRIKIDIFNGGMLGSEAQTLQFVKDGSLDLVISDPSAGAPFAKELDFFALPFLFRNYLFRIHEPRSPNHLASFLNGPDPGDGH